MDGTKEAIALQLLKFVAAAEQKYLDGLTNGGTAPDRDWILDTYAECLEAADGSRVVE